VVVPVVEEKRLQRCPRLPSIRIPDGDEVGAAHFAVADALEPESRAVEEQDWLRRAVDRVLLPQRPGVVGVEAGHALSGVALNSAVAADDYAQGRRDLVELLLTCKAASEASGEHEVTGVVLVLPHPDRLVAVGRRVVHVGEEMSERLHLRPR
jgi:hypothetical protein